jgi:hypothetical protein
VVGKNAAGSSEGLDSTFTTGIVAAVATTLRADSITSSTAKLTGSVNPNNSTTLVRFHYGTTTAYGDSIDATPSPIDGVTAVAVSSYLTGLLPDTLYHFRVVAVNAAGTAYGGDSTFTTLIAPPLSPLLFSPANHAVNQATALTLRWLPALTAESYHLQVGTDSMFTSGIVVNDTALTGTLSAVTGLGHDTKYYWRVAARNVGGMSDWSERWDFTTIVPLPNQVELVAPSTASIVAADSVLCQWKKASPKVIRYRFELASDSLFANIIIDSLQADTTILIHSLLNIRSYWWRVRAENAAGSGPFSEGWTFRVVITDVDMAGGIPTEFMVNQNYPNPFNPSTTIRYGTPVETRVTLKVYNTIGQEVLTLVDETKSPGYYRITFNATHLPSGMYIYRVQMGDFTVSKRMLLVK